MSEFTAFRKNLSYVAMIAMNEKANMTKVMAVIAMMAVVFAGVAVLASDSTDAADAKITYISGEINADTEFGPGTIVVVNGNLTVVNGADLEILDGAKFTVNEGVTLTINGLSNVENDESPKAGLIIHQGADVDVNGTLVVSENGFMNIVSGTAPANFEAGFNVNGTITFQNGTESVMDQKGTITIGTDGVMNVTSIGTKVAKIGNVEIDLMPGATLNMRGIASGEVTVTAITPNTGDENYVTCKASATIVNTPVAEVTPTSANVSNIIFTASSTSATVYDSSDNRVRIETASLDIAGTVQNGDEITTTSESKVGYTDRDDEPVDVMSQVTVTETLTIANHGSFVADSYTAISGTFNATRANERADNTISVGTNGAIVVTGTVTISYNAYEIPQSNSGKMRIDGGSVTINGTSDPSTLKFSELYGAYYYLMDTAGNTTTYIVDLEAAIAAAAENTAITEITVYAGAGSEDNKANGYEGGYVVSEGFDIPANVTLNVYNALIVEEGATINVPVNAFVNVNGVIYVQGTVVDNSLTLALINNGVGVDCEVRMTSNDGATITYTSLRLAIAGAEGEVVIELVGDAVIDANLTIPENVTVDLGTHTMKVTEGATVTVNGVIDAKDGTVETTYETGADDKTRSTGTVVVNNYIIVSDAAEYAQYGYSISGVYVEADIEGIDGQYFIMSVPVFAGYSGIVDAADVQGTVSYADAFTLAAGEDGVNILTISGKVTFGTVTVTGYTIEMSEGGVLTGTIAAANGSVELNMIATESTFTVKNVIDEDEGTDILYVAGTPASVDKDGNTPKKTEDNVATLAVASGAVAVDGELNTSNLVSFGVSEGTTLDVEGTLKTSEFEIAGTVDVAKGATVSATGNIIITGTLTVANIDAEDATYGTVSATGNIYIGTDDEFKAQNGATVTGDNISAGENKVIYVSAESEVTIDGLDTENNTEFYIEDALWMTAYGSSSDMIVPPIANADFTGWENAEDEVYFYDVTMGGHPAVDSIDLTATDRLDAVIDYNIYTVTVLGDNGIGTVAIDGNVLLKSSNMFIASGLTAGTHTISYTLKNGYSGEATISVDGQTISGNSFTLSGTSDDDRTVQIVLSGTEASVQEPVDNSDDGMGITDYLLIILVILVIVLAIFVALRMMRS